MKMLNVLIAELLKTSINIHRSQLMIIKEAVYLGESRRGPQLRSSNHWDDAKASKDQSHVFKHWKESHANEPMPRFGARVIKFYKSSMQRQIGESTLLWRWTKDKGHIRILNQQGRLDQ